MKIIREGDLERMESMRRFECKRCGCVWEASGGEYRVESDFRNGHFAVMRCPTCKTETICYPEENGHGG
jgi:ribosomal protein S27E